MTEWQPIETAPKDGSQVILGSSSYEDISIGVWTGSKWAGTIEGAVYRDEWGYTLDVYATHWRPLPEPPQQTGERR